MIETDVQIRRPIDGGVDVLRQFVAVAECHGDGEPEEVGEVHGWIGWSVLDEDLADAGDAISYDAAQLGSAAAAIQDAYPDNLVDAALLIDRMSLKPNWRGKRLSRVIIADLMALLRFDPESTVVVLQPEPQKPEGGPYDDGAERDEAMARLHAAYRESGLVSWRDSVVWWRPFA